jgi:hypothetical protein
MFPPWSKPWWYPPHACAAQKCKQPLTHPSKLVYTVERQREAEKPLRWRWLMIRGWISV